MLTTKKIALSGLLACSITAGQAQAETFDLLSLYQSAINYDAGIAAAKAAYYAEQQDEDIALAGLLPSLSAGASTGHTNGNNSPQSDDSFNTLRYSVSLSQPLLNLNNWYSLSAAEQNSLRAEMAYLDEEQNLILNVATAYFGVLRAKEDLIAARALETAVKRQYEQAKEQFDVGLIAITDVHEAKATFDDSKTNRIRSEGNLTLSIEQLSRLTGEYAAELESLAAAFPIEIDPNTSTQSWVNAAHESNLAIKAAEYALSTIKAQYQASKADHYPTVDLSAGYENTELSNFAPVDNDTENSSIFLNLNVPLYLGGATQAGVRKNRHLLEQAKHQLSSAKRQAGIEARTEYINLKTNIQTVESLNQNIISRESALEATREGYKVGTRNIVEVLDAERSYFTALRDYASARFDFVESSLRLKRSVGTLNVRDIEELNQWLEPSTK